MKWPLLLLVLFSSTIALSQKVKKIIVDDYDLFCKHEYYVLKKDKTVKHGPYKSTWVTGNPREEGYFKMGLKDSLWTYFDPLRPIIASRGYYENDKKVGIWEYYDEKEQIMHRYNHSNHYLSYTTYTDTTLKHTIRLNDSIMDVKLQRPPIYLLGEKSKFRVIQDNIKYPQRAIEENIYGTVRISFYIDLEGNAIEHEFINQIGGGCDEEAMRVVKLIPNEWIPAVYNNKEVEVRIVLPITFVLN
ncbi:MAG: energy transducer TonB [Crocinitomicaceae bacterium]|nr:energy transducer TonB [Crocinitomicaceae bacterium]